MHHCLEIGSISLIRPEDHWSCIAHLSAESKLGNTRGLYALNAVTPYRKKLQEQRTRFGKPALQPCKIAKFQTWWIISMLSFLVCLIIELSEMGWILALHSLSGTQCAHKVSWGKAFSRILTVFPMLDPRIYIERIELTTQFFFQWSLLTMTNKWAKYDFVSTMRSYLKTTFFKFFVHIWRM